MARILIIDDDPAMVSVISDICQERGHQTVAYSSGSKALENLSTHAPQLVITDMRMDKVGGLDILRECKEVLPQTPVILITAYKTVETALEAMKLGAYDYITKPFKVDELQLTIQRALDNQSLVRENKNLRQIVKEKYRFENIIGTSGKMQEIYNLIAKVADTDSHHFDPGRKRHRQGTRRPRAPFQQQSPAPAIRRDQLLSVAGEPPRESELFGHKKGIVHRSGGRTRSGLFEEAELGTIFLDEVNSMAQPLQTKLLRVLQERQIRRVGDNEEHRRSTSACSQPRTRGSIEKTRQRQFPRGSLLPARGHPDRDARAPRADRRCAAFGKSLPAKERRADPARSPKKIEPKADGNFARAIAGPETSGNWKTRSSARVRCATTISSA